MKNAQVLIYAGGVALVGLGVAMALTNPQETAYQSFASQQLSEYVVANVCNKEQNPLGNLLQGQCSQLVEAVQPQLRSLIEQTTQRQNFGVFSIYKTELSIAAFLPAYEFETVGVFNNFYTYKAEKKR